MKKVTVSGKTVEEAVKQGLEKLEAQETEVHIRVLEEPQKGFFGLLGARPALVELERKPDPVREGLLFLRDVIDQMGIHASVEQEDRDGTICFHIHSAEAGVLIGKRGQTLDSLQYLVNLAANRQSEEYLRITLDAEGYRSRRKEALEVLAERLAEKAVRLKKEVRLEPMSAHERKMIHHTLQKNPRVTTYSDGKEPNRRIVVVPKQSAN
ncbi:RNA-binding cell elongation regulator Jag/EloR [Alkalicoccus urumqiensis]|uniref:RNA-binding protein KhpB n=1 Tax=Alkalicoccus urumqiensis TaxID=1548213 RepID=A0A2P6MDJ3_ALKUR|nr:RNA-binding cell elongation regulator Jag/EloR [Alkalicoccus urumqiensis]PRO64346.1 protein jag [Alkalicoccus urumqiensis]